ncbi:tetratricopeptide repeat protein [Micromonospora sp. NPDC047793]|uniref:tetratricopeptide repeat protein n=1 Tax=Micromonospora sp. NPDC047793 TaxID=3154342 RepID=UPI0033CFF5BD
MDEHDEELERFDQLLARSSLGTPGARRLRRRTPPSQVAAARRIAHLATAAPAARDLLQVVARLAPDHPFPLSLLCKASDLLPGLAEAACATSNALRETCEALHSRGLLELDGTCVSVRADIAGHVVGQVTPDQSVHWTKAVLRFLTHALRPDTHHRDSWAEWKLVYPHVLAVCEEAERHQIQLGDVGYLLDRASVYLREGVKDPDGATALAERAVTFASTADDRELIGDSLGNLALAHWAANRLADAIHASTASLSQVAETYGTDHETYAESLTIHGNILAAAGRTAEAGLVHEQAVEILRTLHTARPTGQIRGLLVAALNDLAAQLLSTGGPAAAGVELLAEANELVRRGEYGWAQVTMNLARACRAVGDAIGARDHLESVRDHCVKTRQEQSITLICALADLAEVYKELGDSRAGPTLREAHRVDSASALDAASDRPPSIEATTAKPFMANPAKAYISPARPIVGIES